MNKTSFKKRLHEIKLEAKRYGYTSKKDIATYTNGYISGFAKYLTDFYSSVPTQKRKK